MAWLVDSCSVDAFFFGPAVFFFCLAEECSAIASQNSDANTNPIQHGVLGRNERLMDLYMDLRANCQSGRGTTGDGMKCLFETCNGALEA